MAILNDLAKETSILRFDLRWLVATWLSAIVAAVACRPSPLTHSAAAPRLPVPSSLL